MAKIVMKCPYYKPGKPVDGYVRYIATRASVEKPQSEKAAMPAMAIQKKAVDRLVNEYPDIKELYEYEDYLINPTRRNAEEFIARAAGVHPELMDDIGGYVKYIATRPGAMMFAEHGLFSDAGAPIVLEQATQEVKCHKGNVWCHIISLKREDAERLGYADVSAWQE